MALRKNLACSNYSSQPTATRRLNTFGVSFRVVGRVDNVYGDRNLFCGWVPLSDLA